MMNELNLGEMSIYLIFFKLRQYIRMILKEQKIKKKIGLFIIFFR